MEKVKECGKQITAGGTAGLVEVCVMYPLDLVKTRIQLNQKDNGMINCIRKTMKNEGMSGFYKGILPPILAETPKMATKFFAFEQYQRIFEMPSISPVFTISLAGFCSGLTEAFVVCPSEVVKIRLQSMRDVPQKELPSAASVAREIWKRSGMRGLYRGLTATMGRNSTWNMVYFGMYHNMKGFIPDAQNSPSQNLFLRISLGFTAGSLASVANIPFDMAKSRIQGPQPDPLTRKYNGCFNTMSIIYREEGFRALYTGLLPKIMRFGPGGAIIILVYDQVYNSLNTNR